MPGQTRSSDLVFRLSCWGLGVIAFGQLLAGGVALAVRTEKAREVRIVERLVPVTKIVNVPAPVVAQVQPQAPTLPPPVALAPEPAPLPPPRPLGVPAIADPIVERLVMEARKARLASDTASAIIKLEEAKEKAPEDANVLYETGLLFEEMAAYDPRQVNNAADAYQAVLALGAEKAGSLFEMAARKLKEGIALPGDMRGELRLGRVRIFPDDQFKDGERVVLTVPVQAAPGVNPGTDFGVQVEFYDTLILNGKKEIVPRGTESTAKDEWVTAPINFEVGEELLRVTYLLPPQDAQQKELFGKRSYYGQVVKLFYKGELIDSDPYPRHLSSLSFNSAQQQDQLPPADDQFPPMFLNTEENFDSAGGSVLPPIPGNIPPPPKMPDLNASGVPPLPR
jgi:hypothetical protein